MAGITGRRSLIRLRWPIGVMLIGMTAMAVTVTLLIADRLGDLQLKHRVMAVTFVSMMPAAAQY